MKAVPGWFVAVCWTVAVVSSLATGLQYGSARSVGWPLLLGAGAVAAAVLPQRRLFAIASAAVGMIAGLWAAWLIRDGATLELEDILAARGPASLVTASGVMLASSLLRALWA